MLQQCRAFIVKLFSIHEMTLGNDAYFMETVLVIKLIRPPDASGGLVFYRCPFLPSPAIRAGRRSVFGLSVRACVRGFIVQFLNTISYTPLVGISPNLQLKCSWDRSR